MMLVEIENLKRLKTLANNFKGEKGKGVSKQYIIELLRKNNISPVEIDGTIFYDLTQLPEAFSKKLDL